jgi:two-component system chemotaxis response regulator CheY
MRNTCRVLAVDDSAAMLNIISSYLRDSEFELIDSACDGQSAVEKFTTLEPDLVILDLVMPGQSGQETLRQMMELRSDARVAIMSSLGTEEAVQECTNLGARGFLKKPFSKDDLFEFLRGMTAEPVIHTEEA